MGSLLFTLVCVTVVSAANTTVANDTGLRNYADTRSNFVVVDTNNPADHAGLLTEFDYYATTNKPINFMVVDENFIVKWVGDQITPTHVPGVNSYNPTMYVPVEIGWNVGLYYPETGTVPYNYSGDDRAFFTNAGWGLPEVGQQLVFQELIQNRTYSYVAYYVNDEIWDMWKGNFVRGNGATYANAGGQVILNYVKGKKSFNANIDTYGLLPDTQYMAYMLTGGGWPAISYEVGTFMTDPDGYGHLHVNGIAPDALNLDGVNRRFVIYKTWASSGWVLSTSLTVGDGDLQPIGSERGYQ